MRTTQFVGLNNKAIAFVSKLKEIDEGNKTSGMFDEDIPLRSWEHPEKGIIREVVQEVPWSSGPMIFTCLAWDFGNLVGEDDEIKRDDSCTIFEWTHDPKLREQGYEFDEEAGTLWV